MILSTEFLFADGYTGQTTEVFAYPSDGTFPTPFQRIVGVPLKSYLTVSWTSLPPDQTLTTRLFEHEESHDRAIRYSIQSRAAASITRNVGLPQRCLPLHERYHRN